MKIIIALISGALIPLAALADKECVRAHSSADSSKNFHSTNSSDNNYDAMLKNANINGSIKNILIIPKKTANGMGYVVYAGIGDPIFQGGDIGAMIGTIQSHVKKEAANTAFISLLHFPANKAEAMRTNFAIRWKALGAHAELFVRPHPIGEPFTLPPDFFRKSSGAKLLEKPASMVADSNVKILVSLQVGTKNFILVLIAKTQQLANELSNAIKRLLPEWQRNPISAAEMVAQAIGEVRKQYPDLALNDIRAEIHDQVGKTTFVQLDQRCEDVKGAIG